MAFNTGWTSVNANDLGSSDFDWYDGGSSGEYLSPSEGGYPGGIPGYEGYKQGETAPTSPVVPDQTPYDPYADEGPSQPTEGVPVNTPTTPEEDIPEITIKGDRPPAIPDRPVIPDLIQAPPLTLPDLTPYLPQEDIPELVIKAPKPVIEAPPFNPPLIPPGDILQPVPPQEPEIPELVIKDARPPAIPDTPVVPDIIPPGNIDITIPETPTVPETPVTPEPPVIPPIVVPPVIQPPIVQPPTVVPPVVQPPVVQPPVVQPPVVQPPVVQPPVQSGQYLNPGLIETTRFYNEASPTSNQFYWGTGRPLQYGTEFNAKTWNDVPSAERTAWSASPTVSAPMPVLNMQPMDVHSMLSGASSQGPVNLSAEQLKQMMRLLSGRG